MKYILAVNGDASSEELYNMNEDVAQQRNIAGRVLPEIYEFEGSLVHTFIMERSADSARFAERKRNSKRIEVFKKLRRRAYQ